MNISFKHLLAIREITREDIETIFHVARRFKEVLRAPVRRVPALRDVSILNLFFEPSTRTRTSFELAGKRLGAEVINFSGKGSAVEKGETLYDTAKNILAMKVDMIVVRHWNIGAAHFLARKTGVPIINAGDGTHEHPTQGLLDVFTIIEEVGEPSRVNTLIVGDIAHSRVARSDMWTLKKLNGNVGFCAAPSMIPPGIERLGVKIFYDLREGLNWADVVIVLRIQKERGALSSFPSIREYVLEYQVSARLVEELARKGKEVWIMHPGPVNRDVELESALMEHPRSLIFKQVENGVAIRMAVMFLLAIKHAYIQPQVPV